MSNTYCLYTKHTFTTDELDNEEWRDVRGYEGIYQVSNLGRVKALEKTVYWTMPNGSQARRLFPETIKNQYGAGNRRQYKYASFKVDGIETKHSVHRLVLEAFVGPCPDGHQTCHNDGDPENNRVENLRWDTAKNNHADRKVHGTHLNGAQISTSKLTEDDVRCIKTRLAAGESPKDIADDYPCTRANISKINTGKSWTHVTI